MGTMGCGMTAIANSSELNRYTIALGDFRDAIACLDAVEATPMGGIERSALCAYAIVLYARPFSKNERSEDALAIKRLKIEWFDELSEDELELHQWIVERRNQVVAHAEFTHYPTSHDPETGVIGSRRAIIDGGEFSISRIRALAEKLSIQCTNRRADYTIGVRNGYVGG